MQFLNTGSTSSSCSSSNSYNTHHVTVTEHWNITMASVPWSLSESIVQVYSKMEGKGGGEGRWRGSGGEGGGGRKEGEGRG